MAIKEAGKNLRLMDGGPFGACLVKDGKVLAVARNTVLKNDATCHAEINAIRKASKKIKTFDLSGCVIYSTTEPCPMCFSAIHWAKIDKIVYGTRIIDAKKIGFREMTISNHILKKIGGSTLTIEKGFFRKECLKLLSDWNRLPNKSLY